MILTIFSIVPAWAWGLISAIIFLLASKVLLGWVFISADRRGLVKRIWGGGQLENGKIIATKGESGYQADLLMPGLRFGYWPWMYSIRDVEPIVVPEGHIGLVSAKAGEPLDKGFVTAKTIPNANNFEDAKSFLINKGQAGPQRQLLTAKKYFINPEVFDVRVVKALFIEKNRIGIVTVMDGAQLNEDQVAGKVVPGHKSFQDAEMFIGNGGQKGLQEEIIKSGEYLISDYFAKVEVVPQTEVPIGYCGVVVRLSGEKGDDTTGAEFVHGQIVKNGFKGVQEETLSPGMYPINTATHEVKEVPTTNVVLNWANSKSEAHKLDERLSTIAARTKDGFTVHLDVACVISVPQNVAPRVIARFGTLENLITQVLEPTISTYFRNSVQEANAMTFILERKKHQENALQHIEKVLKELDIHCHNVLIGDVVVPEALLKPIQEKHISEQQQITFEQQKKTQEARKDFENATAIADKQKEVVAADLEIQIQKQLAEAKTETAKGDASRVELLAEAEAKATTVKGNAEAGVIENIGKANAKAYQEQGEAIGPDNLANIKVAETLAVNGLQITPQIVTGGSGGAVDALVGLEALKQFSKNNTGNAGTKKEKSQQKK